MGYLIDILIGVVGRLLTGELSAHVEPMAQWIIAKAVKRLPAESRERFREEWLAHLEEVPSGVRKLWHAFGCYLCAAKVARVLARRAEQNKLDDSTLTLTEITNPERVALLEMLVAEHDQQLKNILAIVQSLAWQTASANQSPVEFKRAFDGRLRAISLALDILKQGRWRDLDFDELVERSLAPYQGSHGKRAQWSGSRLSLPANMVIPLSMVFHELSTNAAKYGAFSVEHGRVNIAWRTDGEKVQCTWTETNGPSIDGDIKAGFGSKLISRVISYDLVGTAGLNFDREGFRCTLTFPVPRLRTDALRPSSAVR
jgi:two-component sensor histidine kinase